VDVVGFDGERVLACGGNPSGLGQKAQGSGVAFAGFGQQIDGGGGEDVAVMVPLKESKNESMLRRCCSGRPLLPP
jgi:hypothetical protein